MNDWKYYNHAVISNLPPHVPVDLSPIQDGTIWNVTSKDGEKPLLVRYHTDYDTQEETSFWYVIKDTFGGIGELSTKKRNQVRRSLKTYDFRRVPAEDILAVGLPIYQEACKSYKVKAAVVTEADFHKRIADCEQDGRAEYWCVYRKDTHEAVALAINTLNDDCCEYNLLKCKPSAMHNSTYPYYGLIFEMNRYYLDELKLKYVNDGSRSITNHSNIQPFLIDTFHFRKAYCKLQIEYRWWLNILIKILFPFRNRMPRKVRAILSMEAMRRGLC